MLKGIYLTLMIGPAVPVPVPRVVIDALTSITIHSNSGETQSGFELAFTLSNQSPLHTLFLLAGSVMPPLIRVVIVATINGTPEVLMDGVMTQHRVTPGSGGAGASSTLTVTGVDLSQVMDYFDFSGFPYPALPAEGRVALILAKYAFLGIVPLVIPSLLMDVPIPIERIPVQQGKDLAYVRALAQEVGYVFYVAPGPVPGASVAYWGPDIKVGVPQPALNINMDAFTNVESLNFSFNSEGGTLPIVIIQEPITKLPIPIPIPDVSLLNPPLGAVPPFPKNVDFYSGIAKFSPIRAALYGLARKSQSTDAVTGEGSLDVERYGRILKARQLVGVRGAGQSFDGLYYISSVTSTIKRGEFKQSFSLSRNGLVSTVPNVPV